MQMDGILDDISVFETIGFVVVPLHIVNGVVEVRVNG